MTVDLERARQVVKALRQLKKSLRLKGEPDLAFVARHPDVLAMSGDGAVAQWAEVQPIVERAAADVLVMREREGRALAADLLSRVDALEAGAHTIERRAPERLAAELGRLRQNVAELAPASRSTSSGSPWRSRCSPTGWTSARSWCGFARTSRRCGRRSPAAGRWASSSGFLAQELLREVNTMGSKANDAAITQTVIAMKGELERFREQLENLE